MRTNVINFTTKTQLVEALLACSAMQNRQTRNAIVSELQGIQGISRSDIDRADVTNIVNRVLNFQDGLSQLCEVLRFYEGDSVHMQRVDALYGQHSETIEATSTSVKDKISRADPIISPNYRPIGVLISLILLVGIVGIGWLVWGHPDDNKKAQSSATPTHTPNLDQTPTVESEEIAFATTATFTAKAPTATPILPTATDTFTSPTATSTFIPTATPSSTAVGPSVESAFNCTDVGEIPQSECEALVAIYESTHGPGWSKNRGWLQTNTPCNWYGIECLNGYVDKIKLQHNDLLGELPPEISNLVDLTAFELYTNQIRSIPPEIGNLANLQWLYIGTNELQNLPTEIGNLPKLALLSLSGNPLGSLSAEVGHLPELRELALRNTSLSRLPPTISNLAKLDDLDISANNFGTVPPEIWPLIGLKSLSLSENQLSAIPPEIGNLTNLGTLDLSANLLNDLPTELTNLTRLTELDVGQNHLRDIHPTLQAFLDGKDPDWPASQIVDISSPPTAAPDTDLTYVNPIDGGTYVYVPAGEFVMGSSDGQINYAYELCQTYYGECTRYVFEDAQPQHSVYLDGYWIMQTEVTNAQYRKFMDEGGYTTENYWSMMGWAWRVENNVTEPDDYWEISGFNGAEQPIIDVSWYEAEAYANWLSTKSSFDFGLPSEAQWEKAARGTDGRNFPWGNQWDGSRANHCDKNCKDVWGDKENDDGYRYTAPAGIYPTGVSPYGALNMAGNVWEWTADRYSYGYYKTSPSNNPTGPENGDNRVVRGGSWRSEPSQASTTVRGRWWTPDYTLFDIGFRLVRYDR